MVQLGNNHQYCPIPPSTTLYLCLVVFYEIFLFLAFHSAVYNANFSLGRWFLRHIDDDTLDLVSMDDLIVGMSFCDFAHRN